MIYRIRVDASFTDLPPPDYLRHIRDYFKAHAITVNPGEPNEELSYITLEKCYHDETPPKPCELIQENYTS